MFWKAGQINWDAISRCSCCPRLNESVVVFYIGFKAYLKLVSSKVVSGTGMCQLFSNVVGRMHCCGKVE